MVDLIFIVRRMEMQPKLRTSDQKKEEGIDGKTETTNG